jgi:hypothetical protein
LNKNRSRNMDLDSNRWLEYKKKWILYPHFEEEDCYWNKCLEFYKDEEAKKVVKWKILMMRIRNIFRSERKESREIIGLQFYWDNFKWSRLDLVRRLKERILEINRESYRNNWSYYQCKFKNNAEGKN